MPNSRLARILIFIKNGSVSEKPSQEPATQKNFYATMKFLIYGATKGRGSGLGQAVALALVKRGHQVWGLCRNPEKAAEQKEFPLEAVDLAGEAGQERVKQLIRETDPDAIWSACGWGYAEPLWKLPPEAIEEMIDANVRNNIIFSRTCAPSCIDAGPHLILTGSVAGVLDGTGAAVYAGVKGFLVPFVRAQRAEYLRQSHNAKISLLVLHAMGPTGAGVIAEAVEFIGRQSRAMELLIN
ncbi:MAG TPA: SDR family oxidoreductase [Verrucomicrobiota bacterium]|jgi:NAD(P)-dependent dehydrogenase (short-subunit alcohol dehydrogenase family)|nr:SDR family oxidoreductase [Verrucomicrobiota bacterium]